MLYDTNGGLLTSAAVSIDANVQTVFAVKAECRSGYFLSATAVDDLLVEARRLGDTVWIDIETSPRSLSAFDGTIQDFEIRITAGNVSEITNRSFTLSVSAL